MTNHFLWLAPALALSLPLPGAAPEGEEPSEGTSDEEVELPAQEAAVHFRGQGAG